MQSRLTTVKDISAMGSFFFVDPDLAAPEAQTMVQGLEVADRRKAVFPCI